jgi:hypothetical protein
MAMKQYHFRLDDDDINAGIAHELSKPGAKQSAVMADLLLRGLLALRQEREQTAWTAYQGRVANPARVIYGVQAEEESDDGPRDHPQAEGAEGVPL